MNELTMKEKLLLIGLLGVAYDKKAKLIKDNNIWPYAEYLRQDLEDIRSICDKLVLDVILPVTES